MGKKVLVVTTVPADEPGLEQRLRELVGDADEIRVVAPATKLGKLAWLANDEDDARAQAQAAAVQTAATLPSGPTVTIDRTSHGDDPADSILDALRNFDIDEIVVVTGGSDDSTWLEDQTVRAAVDSTRLPVRHLQM
jgi:hypothetical protein